MPNLVDPEASDVPGDPGTPRVDGTTETVTTDSAGKAHVNFSDPFGYSVGAVSATRVTSSGTKGGVVVTGATTSGVDLLFFDSAGAVEANKSRRVGVVAVGID